MATQSQYTPLADVSRQPLKVGTPPAFIFTENGTRYDRDLVALSVQLRIAEATERIAAALEAQLTFLEGSQKRG